MQDAVGDEPKIQTNSGPAPEPSPFYKAAPVLYLLAVLALAGLLAPVFHWISSGWIHAPFSRYVNRALMVSALAMLIPYFIKNWRHLGLFWTQSSRKELFFGLFVSLGSIVVILTMHELCGSRSWTGQLSFHLVTGALVAALLVSPLEEILFRGVVQKELIARLGTFTGWFVAGLFFAIVHFIKVPRSFEPDPVMWTSGFHSLALAFAPLGNPNTYGSAFFCLLAVGLILGMMFYRTGSLWLPIGLHAGWIFGLKTGSKLTIPSAHPPAFAGGADLLSGGLTLILLALLGLALWRFYPEQPSKTGE